MFTVRRTVSRGQSAGPRVASSAVTVTALGPSWLDPNQLIETFGLLGTLIVIFAECGLLVGFFLPGDTLLFTVGRAGRRRARSSSRSWLVIVLVCVAAIAGNQVGYEIGRAAGPALFNRPDSRLFKPEYVERTQRVLRQVRSAGHRARPVRAGRAHLHHGRWPAPGG